MTTLAYWPVRAGILCGAILDRDGTILRLAERTDRCQAESDQTSGAINAVLGHYLAEYQRERKLKTSKN